MNVFCFPYNASELPLLCSQIFLELNIVTLSWMARRLEGCIKTLYPSLVRPLMCLGARGALRSQAFTSSLRSAITGLWWRPLKRQARSLATPGLCTRSIFKSGSCKGKFQQQHRKGRRAHRWALVSLEICCKREPTHWIDMNNINLW